MKKKKTIAVGGDGDDRDRPPNMNRPDMNRPDWQPPYGNILIISIDSFCNFFFSQCITINVINTNVQEQFRNLIIINSI